MSCLDTLYPKNVSTYYNTAWTWNGFDLIELSGNEKNYKFIKEEVWKLYIELPGIDKKDIKIEIEFNDLKITYPNKKYWEKNSAQNSILRWILDTPFIDSIESKFENGVLEISFGDEKDKKPTKKIIEIK